MLHDIPQEVQTANMYDMKGVGRRKMDQVIEGAPRTLLFRTVGSATPCTVRNVVFRVAMVVMDNATGGFW